MSDEAKKLCDPFPQCSDACVYCGLCGKKCPVGAIQVDRRGKSWQVDREKCVRCGVCADTCSKGAICLEVAYTEAEDLAPSKGRLVCQESLCAGCSNCLFACSLSHEGVASLELSRIQLNAHTQAFFEICALPCAQCDDPKCLYACPVGAIHVHPTTGARVIDSQVCVGCQRCIQACPFDIPRIRFNKATKKAIKCDLCGGDPMCVKMCPSGALRYVTDRDFDSTEGEG